MKTTLPLALAVLATGAGCDRPADSASTTTTPSATASAAPTNTSQPVSARDSELLTVGRQVTTLAFSTLSSNLLGALGRSTPADALEFCSVNVGPLLQSLQVPPGTRVHRVSHRPRNPANRAGRDEVALIESHSAALAAGRTNPPSLQPQPDGSVTFYAPILLGNPACLLCHGQSGTEIAPATATAIARLYPADEAYGFRLGEVRGLWAVTFPGR